jgi:hypothetical protein
VSWLVWVIVYLAESLLVGLLTARFIRFGQRRPDDHNPNVHN